MDRLARLVAGPRTKWVTLAVWFVGIFIAVGPAQLPTKFTEAEENSSTSFLPGDAESTRALKASEELQGGEKAAMVVVYRRASGLTAADRRRIARDIAELNRLKLRATTPFRVVPAGGRGARTSPDGSATLISSEITSDGDSDTLLDPVDAVRERVSDPGGGLEVKVTGPAGYSADAIKVFEGINGTLLLAAGLLVFVLLIIIYRSPIFLFIPLIAVIFAEMLSRSIGYGITELGVTVNGQSSSILSVLVLGAGTDYALLLVARYREELRKHEDRHEALALALKTAGPAIVASGMTVVAAMLCLTIAELNGTSGLGPIAAMAILVAMLSMLTLLPALLVITGRGAFWPYVPHFGDEGSDATHGFWRRVADWVGSHPRRVAVSTTLLLLVLAAGTLNFSDGLTSGNQYVEEVESVQGQELISKSFPGGSNAPVEVIVPPGGSAAGVARAVGQTEGVASVRPVTRGDQGTLLNAVLEPEPFSTEAYDLIPGIREAAREAGGPETLVGGSTAVELDVREAAARDTRVIVPIALVVVLLILILLLRALVAPLILIATVILSFFAALGVGAVVFDVVFGFPGSDPSLPLFAFIFLVALGIDYNIFLMARVREETLKFGTREGMKRGLAVTGGVITAAGVVLAGTFSVLAVLPLVFLTEIGFVIAFGVLLDTIVVRSLLVPSLVFKLGPKIWWPSSLADESDSAQETATGPARPQAMQS
jgi:RND superfamily putative drug exporter